MEKITDIDILENLGNSPRLYVEDDGKFRRVSIESVLTMFCNKIGITTVDTSTAEEGFIKIIVGEESNE